MGAVITAPILLAEYHFFPAGNAESLGVVNCIRYHDQGMDAISTARPRSATNSVFFIFPDTLKGGSVRWKP